MYALCNSAEQTYKEKCICQNVALKMGFLVESVYSYIV